MKTKLLCLLLAVTLFALTGCSGPVFQQTTVGSLGKPTTGTEAAPVTTAPAATEPAGTTVPPETTTTTTVPPETTAPAPTLVDYQGYKFSMKIPSGWVVNTRTDINNEYFWFRVFDPANEEREIFFFSRLEPLAESSSAVQAWTKLGFPGIPLLPEYSAKGYLSIWDDCIAFQKSQTGKVLFPVISNPQVEDQNCSVETNSNGYYVTSCIGSCRGCNGSACTVFFNTTLAPNITLAKGLPPTAVSLGTYGLISPQEAFQEDSQLLVAVMQSLRMEDGINPSTSEAKGLDETPNLTVKEP